MSSRDGRVCDSGLVDSAPSNGHRRPRLENEDIANLMFGKTFGAPEAPSSPTVSMPSYKNEADDAMPNLGAPNVSMGSPNAYAPQKAPSQGKREPDSPVINNQRETIEKNAPQTYSSMTDPRVMQQKILMEEAQNASNQIAAEVPESMQSNFNAAVMNEARQQALDEGAKTDRQEAYANTAPQQGYYNSQQDFANNNRGLNEQQANNTKQRVAQQMPRMQNNAPQYAENYATQYANQPQAQSQPQEQQALKPQAQPQPQYYSQYQGGRQVYRGEYQENPASLRREANAQMQGNGYAPQQSNNEAFGYAREGQQPSYTSPFENSQKGGFNNQPQNTFNSVPRYAEEERRENIGYNYRSLDRPQGNRNIFGKRIISVYCTKGGSGKSSVSKELACAFVRDDAKINGRRPRVLLVDLDFSASDLHTIFNIPPSTNLMSWVNLMRRDIQSTGSIPPYDKYTIDKFVRKNVCDGLDILVGPQMSQDKALITVEIVKAVCRNLSACDYDIIIYDNAPSHEELTLTVLEHSDEVVVLSTVETTTIAELQGLFRILRERSFDASKLKMVVNNVPTSSKNLDIVPQEITEYFEIEPLGMLPHDDNVRLANNKSESLLLSYKNTPYVKAMMEIANKLVPVYNTEKKQGFFSKLFSKKK